MRILELYLKNSAHIYSGLGKSEIHLDFTDNDKIINVIIGKMGSCKTVILGHLQPFSTFGTLDARNQDNVILNEKNGEKRIVYKDNMNTYEITHKYSWLKDHHTTKSYFKKNGEELNPNGNVSSFKTLVEVELGIDQNYLRLLRLGPNVSNLINLKASERKSFIASMLTDVEVYALINKKLNEELRMINAQATVLTTKINSLSPSDIASYNEEYKRNLDAIEECKDSISDIRQIIADEKAFINSVLKSSSIDSYKNELKEMKIRQETLFKSLEKDTEVIEKTNAAYKDIDLIQISKMIGTLESEYNHLSETKLRLEGLYEDAQLKRNSLKEKSLIVANTEHLKTLTETFNELTQKYNAINESLKGFNYQYDSAFVLSLMSKIQSIDILISELYEYDRDTVLKLISNGDGEMARAKKKTDILIGKKINLQKRLNNTRYIAEYEPITFLYTPPGCGLYDNCPYYKTHPYTAKKNNTSSKIEDERASILDQIKSIDIELDLYAFYPIISGKINALKSVWFGVTKRVDEIGALYTKDIYKVFASINKSKWYNYDKIADVLEKCRLREKSYEFNEQIHQMKEEIDSFKSNENIEEELAKAEKELADISHELSDCGNKVIEIHKQLETLNDDYYIISNLDSIKMRIDNNQKELQIVNEKIKAMNGNIDKIDILATEIKANEFKVLSLNTKLKEITSRNEKILFALNDVKFAKEEYEKIVEKIRYRKLLQEATSSSKGIPLVFVKLFLCNCIEIINELISDVFGDTIEILDFNITETEFTIPYAKNGIVIDDISKASQGQQSIISLALSFALMRQGESKYNIPLLDEMDGSLYKVDREKFIMILFKQIRAIDAEQIFVISHNNTFNGQNVNIIMTTDEEVEDSSQITVMHV